MKNIFSSKKYRLFFKKKVLDAAYIQVIPKWYITWGLQILYGCIGSMHWTCTVHIVRTDPRLYTFLESA